MVVWKYEQVVNYHAIDIFVLMANVQALAGSIVITIMIFFK